MASERWAEAVIELKEAIEANPMLTVAHYDLGQCFMALKRYPDAIKAYLGARDAFMALTILEQKDRLAADQERDDQIREMRQLLTRLRQNASYAATMVRIEDQIRDLEAVGKKGLERQVEAPAEFSLALGSAYYRAGALDDAEREYSAAIRARPSFGEAHNNLAVVYMLTGRLDEAKSEIGLAEKGGFKVSSELKTDLEQRMKGQ